MKAIIWVILMVGIIIYQRRQIMDLQERNDWLADRNVPSTWGNILMVPDEDLYNLPEEAKEEMRIGDNALPAHSGQMTQAEKRRISDFRKKYGL